MKRMTAVLLAMLCLTMLTLAQTPAPMTTPRSEPAPNTQFKPEFREVRLIYKTTIPDPQNHSIIVAPPYRPLLFMTQFEERRQIFPGLALTSSRPTLFTYSPSDYQRVLNTQKFRLALEFHRIPIIKKLVGENNEILGTMFYRRERGGYVPFRLNFGNGFYPGGNMGPNQFPMGPTLGFRFTFNHWTRTKHPSQW